MGSARMPVMTPPAALTTPSRLEAASQGPRRTYARSAAPAPAPASEEARPAPLETTQPKLTSKQQERLDRLMAAVRDEFNSLLAAERRKPGEG